RPKLGKQCVAVMAMRVYGISAVGKFGPDGVRKEFILADGRPARQTSRMAMVGAQHFLQKNNVGVRGPDGIAQLMQDEAPIEKGEALMGIHRQYAQCIVKVFCTRSE